MTGEGNGGVDGYIQNWEIQKWLDLQLFRTSRVRDSPSSLP